MANRTSLAMCTMEDLHLDGKKPVLGDKLSEWSSGKRR
jgi:hypothetical protein